MAKNKSPEAEAEAEDEATLAPRSYEHYSGMSNTAISGLPNFFRFKLAEQLQTITLLLGGDTPNLYALEARKMLGEVGGAIEHFEQSEDPAVRKTLYQEIVQRMDYAQKCIVRSKEILADPSLEGSDGLVALQEPDKATLVIPPDWDAPGKSLH